MVLPIKQLLRVFVKNVKALVQLVMDYLTIVPHVSMITYSSKVQNVFSTVQISMLQTKRVQLATMKVSFAQMVSLLTLLVTDVYLSSLIARLAIR